MLRIEHLQIDGLPVFSFEVADGECLAVEGPSGSGKTRLLRAIADLDAASGHVFLDGAERSEMTASAWRKLVRYVAAEPGWWSDTPRDAFPADADTDGRLNRLLASLDLSPHTLDAPLAHLSTGERQRLALVRALLDEPKVLLLDEPTAALDATSAALVEECIRFRLLAGGCVILTSHDAAQVERLTHARLQLAGARRPPAPVELDGRP